MARVARKIGFTGYYHVIMRGVGKQVLFECDRDFCYYIKLLQRYAQETGVDVCAYCLMENHVHLLVHDPDEELSLFMKKLGVSYAWFFNKKYDRTGHLFQDRYISEAVETESYLLTVFRYILNNPSAAGICPASEYLWSSYEKYGDPESFVNTKLLQRMLGDWESYAAFVSEKNKDQCMEYYLYQKEDGWIQDKIFDLLGVESGTILKSYDRKNRNEALRKLKDAGLTIRQIERHTGISKSIAQRA